MITDILLPTFTILAGAFFLDFILNGGAATSACIKSFGTLFHGHPNSVTKEYKDGRMDMIKDLKNEIDDLYDDLSYEDDENEIAIINKRIETKREILNALLSKTK